MNPPPLVVQQKDNVTNEPSAREHDENLILGVKTIRYHKKTWDVKTAATFLKENFPCSRVIVNIRSDIDGQSRSINTTFTNPRKKHKCKDEDEDKGIEDCDGDGDSDQDDGHEKDEKDPKEMIQEMNDYLTHLTTELGEDMAQLIDMTEWIKDVTVLNNVVEWLGFKHCQFRSIVHENAGGYERDHDTTPNVSSKCHYPDSF